MSLISERPLWVIGHKNPDTDAIAAAIGYAEFLRQTRAPEALAACCGPLNARTRWVVRRARVAEPRLVIDVRPTAESVCRQEAAVVREGDTFLDAYRRMEAGGYRAMPLVDGSNRVKGLVELADLLALLVPGVALPEDALGNRRLWTSLDALVRTLGGRVIHGVDGGQEREFILMVAASSEERVAAMVKGYPREQLLMVVGDRPAAQRAAIDHGTRAILVTGGHELDGPLLEQARARGVAVLGCPQDTASAVSLARCSQPAARAAIQIETIRSTELLARVRRQITKAKQVLFPVVDPHDGRLAGVISKSDLLEPRRTRLVLVDHNEFSQAVDGAEEAEILEVLDHHRLSGDLTTREPVRFVNEIIGSTSTLVALAFRDAGLEPQPGTALCLLAGMISDTLKLTSPTTTPKDREVLPWLAGLARVDIDEFAREFFAAGSMLRELPVAELLEADRKEYEEAGTRLSISQIEELGLEPLDARRAEIRVGMEALRAERGLDAVFLLVTDIEKHASVLMAVGDEAILERIDAPHDAQGDFLMEGVVSRKKQFFPYLANRLAGVREE